MNTRRIALALISLLVIVMSLVATQCPTPTPTMPTVEPTRPVTNPTSASTKIPEPTEPPTPTPMPTQAPAVTLPQTPLLTVGDLVKLGLTDYTLPKGIQLGWFKGGGYYQAKFAKPGVGIYVNISVYDSSVRIGPLTGVTIVPTKQLGQNSLFYEGTDEDGSRYVGGSIQVKDNMALHVRASESKAVSGIGGARLAAPLRDDVSVDTMVKLAEAQLARLPDQLAIPEPAPFPTEVDSTAGTRYFESIVLGTLADDSQTIAPSATFTSPIFVWVSVDESTVSYDVGFYDPVHKMYLVQDVGILPGEPFRENQFFDASGQFEVHVVVGDVLAAVIPFEVK